jgi:hypothetical protein
MRSNYPLIIMKFSNDASISYLTTNGKWVESINWYAIGNLKNWRNSGNAWNCIAKLVKNNKEQFEELFVMANNELTNFTEEDAISFSLIQSLTTDQGELDAIAKEALEQKTEQIYAMEETLDELRVTMIHGSED